MTNYSKVLFTEILMRRGMSKNEARKYIREHSFNDIYSELSDDISAMKYEI